MTCQNCNSVASRIRIVSGRELCASCGGFSEAGGTRTEGVLARQRTRDQGAKYEGDTLNPWAYNKAEKAFVPNDEFVKRHAGSAMNFYKPEDLKAYPKLANKIKNQAADMTKVESVGNGTAAFKDVVKKA